MNVIGLVIHPTRAIDQAIETLRSWAADHGVELVQLPTPGTAREIAPFGRVHGCDLVVAIGGDGTVLTALRAAETTGTPVLGVACGSLGALSAVTAGEIVEALEAFESGTWTPRRLPMLTLAVGGRTVERAFNDVVLVRRTGQLAVDIVVDGELYARRAGDGLIVATALGSSAYSMAAGGPVIAGGTSAFVATPLAAHGGCAPPLVVPADAELMIDAHPGYGGFDLEVDGHRTAVEGSRFVLTLTDARAVLVGLETAGRGLEPLRRRGLITDSPRVLARDERARQAAEQELPAPSG